MTIEEKMEHFKNVSLDNASAKSNDILTAYKQSLDEQFEKHKETALLESKSVESAKLNAVRLEVKRELSKVQAEVRRTVTLHQNKLKSQIFSAVVEKLNAYKKTEEYKKELISQINKISSDFNDTTVEFYIDSSDESLLSDLQSHTGADIKISTVPFIGGCKAIISDKNMLVNNSFKTKLAEEQEKFTISI